MQQSFRLYDRPFGLLLLLLPPTKAMLAAPQIARPARLINDHAPWKFADTDVPNFQVPHGINDRDAVRAAVGNI